MTGADERPMYTPAMFNPKACPRVSGGTADTIRAMDATLMNAVPIPWITLEKSNNSLEKEKHEIKTPIIVTIIPINNDFLRPYLLVSFPKGIDNAAIASRNMVATQF